MLHRFFTVSAQNIHTLCQDFHNLSIVMKTSWMVIKPKALHIPRSMLLFHRPAQAAYHRLCSGLSYAYQPCTPHRVNTILMNRCKNYGLGYIDNSNMEVRSLAQDGLHLNEKGKSCLANNFINFINRYIL